MTSASDRISKATLAAAAQRTAAAQRSELLSSTISKLEEAGLLPGHRNNYECDKSDVDGDHNVIDLVDDYGVRDRDENLDRNEGRDRDEGRNRDEGRGRNQNNQSGLISSLTGKGYRREIGNRGQKVGFGPIIPEVSITRERSTNLPQHSEVLSLSPPRRRLSNSHQIGTLSHSKKGKSIFDTNNNDDHDRNSNNRNVDADEIEIGSENGKHNNNGNNNALFDDFIDKCDLGYKVENEENDDFDVGTDSDESPRSSPLAQLSMIRVTSFSAFSSAPIYDAEDAERRIGKLRKERRRQVALTDEFIRLRLLFARNSISLLISKAVKKRSHTI